jgi:hypothetical protein
VIVGVVIGGILKGAEMVENARIASSIEHMGEVKSAVELFRRQYNELPGDMRNPAGRLPNCANTGGNSCGRPGNGDRVIGPVNPMTGMVDGAIVSSPTLDEETSAAWRHLAAADFISDVQINPSSKETGISHPKFPLGGASFISTRHQGSNFLGVGTYPGGNLQTPIPTGDYFATTSRASGVGTETRILLGKSVRAIDQKIDDGMPNTGLLIAHGRRADALPGDNCVTTSHNDGAYILNARFCGIMFRVN